MIKISVMQNRYKENDVLITKSSPAVFQVKPGYAVIHFELPCGPKVSKQVQV